MNNYIHDLDVSHEHLSHERPSPTLPTHRHHPIDAAALPSTESNPTAEITKRAKLENQGGWFGFRIAFAQVQASIKP
jgi:hypothetical protein